MKNINIIILFLLLPFISLYPQQDTLNLIPLTELGTELYKGFEGGLYPGGSNEMPASHFVAGLNISKSVVPLDIDGEPDEMNGKIVLLSIGMSNCTQEYSTFKQIADTLRIKNTKLVVVDGAQGGQTATKIMLLEANFWTVVNQRLSSAKVSANQVQAIWLKEADANPKNDFPLHAQTLSNELKIICNILKNKFPNVKICYFSSRIYGGYATTGLNPEPMAYESGLSVKWVIEAQINGDSALVYDGDNAKSPWLAWGPYLWANGTEPREDGLIWELDDLVESDRTHPSPSGRLKVANMLKDFFTTDETAMGWFLEDGQTDVSDSSFYGNVPASAGMTLNIYPNPAGEYIEIKFSESLGLSGGCRVMIYNALGECVMVVETGLRPVSTRVDVSGLPIGIYFIKFNKVIMRFIKY